MTRGLSQPRFLPVSREECDRLGIGQPDVILVTGDAYVDHPSFGTALIGRVLWDGGFTVAIIPQPHVDGPSDITSLGAPRLFFGIASGAVDSMVNHYTAAKRQRSTDAYSPGGIPCRPDRALLVYTDLVHRFFPGVPLVLGGIEASLRRFAHYDYWEDRVRRSVLADAPADILVYGMGERQVTEIARRLAEGAGVRTIRDLEGTCVKVPPREWAAMDAPALALPPASEAKEEKDAFCRAQALLAQGIDSFHGSSIVQDHGKTVIVQNPPAAPLSTAELDRVYELPFTRQAHPIYSLPIPALEPVRWSITSHRGCIGGCAFCALALHQGRVIQSRSQASIIREAKRIARMREFRGTISDIGGPTANMYGLTCPFWTRGMTCGERPCGTGCPRIRPSLAPLLGVLRAVRAVPGIRHVAVSSGIRYDLIPPDEDPLLAELCTQYISGHLKVAPEHVSPGVLRVMGKPGPETFTRFLDRFSRIRKEAGLRNYVLPYFLSGHPGCTVEDMVLLAEFIQGSRLYTEQVQDFTPTPMSDATAMYVTGMDPRTMEPVHVPKGHEKEVQRAILHYRDPRNRDLVEEGLRQAGRADLIGPSPGSLIPPAGRGEKRSRRHPR